jgi:hypothetical protein
MGSAFTQSFLWNEIIAFAIIFLPTGCSYGTAHPGPSIHNTGSKLKHYHAVRTREQTYKAPPTCRQVFTADFIVFTRHVTKEKERNALLSYKLY